MRYLSVCSGIEAASVAWHPLGWEPVAFSEIEPFPCAVLAHHYPTVPNWGDMTRFAEWPDADIDVLVGGTPCQSFSVAGLRKGLDDPRGNLMLTFGAIARRYRPTWLCWENVPGVLSSDGGRDFGTFLGMLAELGYGFAYRVLDAQYVRVDGHARAVPQRRRRVFVVGHLGDWRRAAAVLFERESLSGHPAPRREAGEGVAPTVSSGPPFSRTGNERVEADAVVTTRDVAHALACHMAKGGDPTTDNYVAHTPIGFCHTNRQPEFGNYEGVSPSVKVGSSSGGNPPAVAFDWQAGGSGDTSFRGKSRSYIVRKDGNAGSVQANKVQAAFVPSTMAVRRVTPRECERLQAFPDDYTDIPWRGKKHAPDGPRYKALGNSMAVNCMNWIGQRIALATEHIALEEVA